MAKALRKLGFRFVGPTTAYALMQATGMVDDHLADCYRGARGKMSAMRYWSVTVSADRYAAERLYHHDVLELAVPDGARPGDQVALDGRR